MKPKVLIRVSDGERFVRNKDGRYSLERSKKWEKEGHLIMTYDYEVLINETNQGLFVPEEEYITETSMFPEAIRLMKFRHKLEKYLRIKFKAFRISDSELDELINELEKIEMELYKK